MSYLTEDLIQKQPFNYSNSDKEVNGDFYLSLMEELCFHYDNNKLYQRFCNNKGFNPHSFNGDISEIPPVSVSVFKELGKELSSVSEKDIKLTLQSSATSGIPSSVLIDKITSKRQAKTMAKVIGDYIGKTRKPFLIMDVDPRTGFRNLLGARYAAVSGYLNFASHVGYFLKINDKHQYYFDTEGIREYINNLSKDEPAIVFGFTYILYSEVIVPNLKNNNHFNLPKGSKVIHIGGWKKLENEKVSKEIFNQSTAELFGIDPSDIIDIYGFTEQMGLNYPDCKCGCKHVPLYSDVIVRDPVTKKILPNGQVGQLEFITPIPHSYPGNVVLTDDIGVIENGECSENRSGKRFRIIGRLKKAEVRGCGDILSSKLKFTEKKTTNEGDIAAKDFLDIQSFSGDEIPSGLSSEETLGHIINDLKKRISWIREQPIDALIGLIAKVAKKWNDPNNPEMLELRERGMGFISEWCSAEHLNYIATTGLRGNRMHIAEFIPFANSSIQSIKAISKGLVCHWLAGNVQVLGMFALVESILTKNVNLLKVSSRDNGVFKLMLLAFKDEEFTTHGGYTIRGNDLLKTISLVYYKHSNESLGKLMSASANARIAWGGRESIETICKYPSMIDCEDIIMGPKLSFAVVSKEYLQDERKVKKIARKIAVDASVFDQTGCASAHNVFIENGGNISPKQFSEYLAEGMKKVALQIPKMSMSTEQISAIHSVRGIYDFKGEVFGDEDSIWTVLYDEDFKLNNPIYSRVVFTHPVNDINDCVAFVDDNIQTIGLAASGQKALTFANKAANAGAMRFPDCGKMLNFDSPWDGMFIMDRLVRWITVGGPLV